MILFILGVFWATCITLFYNKKIWNVFLLFILFTLVTLILNYSSFFKSWIKNLYEVTLFLSVMFLHVFFVLGYPYMVKSSLKKYSDYIPFFTRVFLCLGYVSTLFALYMFFIKGVIYD